MADRSIFHRVAINENSYTQLLCNLMIRFPDFRYRMLERLLPSVSVSRIMDSEIHTQCRLEANGCPDIVIDSQDILALVEVKLDLRRKLTHKQMESQGTPDPKTYLEYLAKERKRKTCLVFLVPSRWDGRVELERKIKYFREQNKYTDIEQSLVRWEEILDLAQGNFSKTNEPLLGEFLALLQEEFMPITFSKKDVVTLFSNDFAEKFEAIRKLEILISEIAKKAKAEDIPYYLEKTRWDDFGIYFGNGKGEDKIWFGIWPEFIKGRSAPLSFGTMKQNLVDAFKACCGGSTETFEDYTIRSFGPEIMTSPDPVRKVWEQLEPVLKNMLSL